MTEIDAQDIKLGIGQMMFDLWAVRKELAAVQESSRRLLEATSSMACAHPNAMEDPVMVDAEVVDVEPTPLLQRREG